MHLISYSNVTDDEIAGQLATKENVIFYEFFIAV